MPNPSQETSAKSKDPATGKKSKKNVVIIVILVLLLVAAGIIIFLLTRPKPEDDGLGVVTDDNLGYIGNQLAEKVDKATFQTYMNTVWKFPKGSEPSSNAVIGNSDSNNYAFYFTVVLDETGEELYESGLIPVGRTVASLKLDKSLPKGEYDATCLIQLVDVDGEPIESDLGFAVTLIVEN